MIRARDPSGFSSHTSNVTVRPLWICTPLGGWQPARMDAAIPPTRTMATRRMNSTPMTGDSIAICVHSGLFNIQADQLILKLQGQGCHQIPNGLLQIAAHNRRHLRPELANTNSPTAHPSTPRFLRYSTENDTYAHHILESHPAPHKRCRKNPYKVPSIAVLRSTSVHPPRSVLVPAR
jgi:hypothetical protein